MRPHSSNRAFAALPVRSSKETVSRGSSEYRGRGPPLRDPRMTLSRQVQVNGLTANMQRRVRGGRRRLRGGGPGWRGRLAKRF